MTPPAAAGETTARTGTGSHGEDEDLGVQDGDLALASLFPAPSREQWRRLVAGVLAKSGKPGLEGQDAEKALSTALEDGLSAQPLYTADDQAPDPGFPGTAPYVRGNRPHGAVLDGWDIRQYHGDPRPDAANQAVLADLENGVTSLWLEIGDQGLPIDALPKVLDGVYLDLAAVVLDAGPDFGAAAQRLFKLYDERGVPDGQATGNLGADPLGLLARTGADERTESLLAEAAELAGTCAQRYPGVRALTVDALAYHDAGASPAQELGSALATAVAYLRQLTDAGLPVADAAGQLEFRYAATADQFLTIAKLRVARRLWARVLEASGAPEAAASNRLHAVTSSVMMTERDPWVNILRTTVACMAAGVGGAESVTVLPFDDVVGLPDDFTRRVARNTQSILLDESHLGRVVDPAGGSWYVERLTDDLARAAWAWFQEIERAGGMRSALVGGLVAERIGAAWERRTAAIARRREPILGVSEFPNLGEKALTSVRRPGRRGGGLPRVRRAEAFEALRDRAEELLVRDGSRPRIALVALGSEAVYSARSSFAANLFQAGGIEGVVVPVPVESGSGADADALRAALADSEAKIACLCSSDALYAEHATEVARILGEAGIQRIWLAGRPGERAEEYREAGVEEFVYVGCDVLSALNTAYAAIGEF
ncbi:methylmalonyl-CoA mutase subunit beta [Catenulispora sp. NF23]|uniref:methylmalonyl-CoA mutase subunit beta n=1 Tax=Catenulispora pinistramenti TaxID=2705254 RepID=UPI001BA85AA1|nr:methylmalonyl-CoA mutase subunit beta [Catenulispora pinistramenti]MBS2537199.1 methylmalonyl-CoA mutase subunit beta [Catenulispora pinistramenti]